MASYKVGFAFYLVCFILDVNGLNTCNRNIINNIMGINNCPPGVLSQFNAMSPFTFAVNPKGSVPDYIQCTNGQIDAPSNGVSAATVTAYYNNTMRTPANIRYTQQDVGCGHIREWDEQNNEYQIYIVMLNPVAFGYYRCTTYETEGSDFAACAVPVSQTNNPEVANAIRECKTKLKIVGVAVEDLVDLVRCGA